MSNEETQNNSVNDSDNFDPDALEETSFDESNNNDEETDEDTEDLESSDIEENASEDEIDDEVDDDFDLDENPEDHPMKHSGSKYLSKYPTRILIGVLLIAGAIIIFALTDVDNKKKVSETDMSKVNIGDNSMFANAINDSAGTNGIIPEKSTDNSNNKDSVLNNDNQLSDNSKSDTLIQPYTPKLQLVDPNSGNYQYSENANNTLSRDPSQLEQQKEREIIAIRQQKIGLFTSSVNSSSKITHNFKELKNNAIGNSNNPYISSHGIDASSVYAGDTTSKLEYIQNERNRINAMLEDGTNNKFQQTLASMKSSSRNNGMFENGSSNNNGNNELSLGVISQNADGSMQTTVASSNGATNNRWELSSTVQIPKKYSVMTGSVIPATLITGINSDLPGQILAQVSQNVFDSPTGRYLLIPQGTRIIGSYDNGIIFGQERVLVSWNRLVFPDGKNIDIGSMNAADQSGYAGANDLVNNHYLRLFGSSLLLSVISAGVTYSQDKYSRNRDNSETTASGAMAQSLGNQMGQTTMQVIQKHMNISPTLEIRPGFRLNVMVTKDILFSKPYTNYDY
ncbi:MAG: TrbI/VirB10 family protein [Succinivibrionaceae bacterium]